MCIFTEREREKERGIFVQDVYALLIFVVCFAFCLWFTLCSNLIEIIRI